MPGTDLASSPRHMPRFGVMVRFAIGILCAGCTSDVPPPTGAELARLKSEAVGQRLSDAKDDFYAAVAGDREALGPAVQILDSLGGSDSGNPEVIAYLGACKLLQASHTAFFVEKAALGRDGLALEDRAVAEAPDNLEVRFLRGVTNYQLPKFLNRFALAAQDLAAVARVAEQAALDGRLDPRAASADLDYHGKVLEDSYNAAGAIAAWKAAVRLDPTGPGGRDALKHLA